MYFPMCIGGYSESQQDESSPMKLSGTDEESSGECVYMMFEREREKILCCYSCL